MSDNLKTTVKIPLVAVRTQAALAALPEALPVRIAKALDRRSELVVGYIQEHKLSKRGAKTLGVLSNRLWSSAARFAAVVRADKVVSSIGTNVIYGGVHEGGFKGTQKVKAHKRKAPAFAFGHKVKKTSIGVRAHNRKVDIPARRMFGSGIEENAAKYEADLVAVIDGALGV